MEWRKGKEKELLKQRVFSQTDKMRGWYKFISFTDLSCNHRRREMSLFSTSYLMVMCCLAPTEDSVHFVVGMRIDKLPLFST